jgi:RNA polymerase sigma factor (sigma-70 family)
MQERARTKHECEISDGILVQHTLAGDEDAYTLLVQRYRLPLFRFICRFLSDSDAADDLLQEVFLRLYLSLPKLRTDTPLKPWLFQVAQNRCLDELRRKQVIHFSTLQGSTEDDEHSLMGSIPDPDPLPEEVAERHDVQTLLQQAIATLPPKYRSIVLLHYVAQLTFPEIGHVLQMPEATAKTYFQRSKPLLRAALAEKFRPLPYTHPSRLRTGKGCKKLDEETGVVLEFLAPPGETATVEPCLA